MKFLILYYLNVTIIVIYVELNINQYFYIYISSLESKASTENKEDEKDDISLKKVKIVQPLNVTSYRVLLIDYI